MSVAAQPREAPAGAAITNLLPDEHERRAALEQCYPDEMLEHSAAVARTPGTLCCPLCVAQCGCAFTVATVSSKAAADTQCVQDCTQRLPTPVCKHDSDEGAKGLMLFQRMRHTILHVLIGCWKTCNGCPDPEQLWTDLRAALPFDNAALAMAGSVAAVHCWA